MQLLLINPNTSAFVTQRMVQAARQCLAGAAQVKGVTATQGPAIVADRAGNAQAAESALELGLAHAAGADALILGISTDAGLDALRRACSVPVVGMLEAGVLTAVQRGRRVGLMTLGPQMLPLYQERAHDTGLAGHVAAWSAPSLPAAYGQSPGPEVDDALSAHAQAWVEAQKLDVLLLCGAVLAGSRSRLAPRLSAVVIDATEAAAWQALSLAAQARSQV